MDLAELKKQLFVEARTHRSFSSKGVAGTNLDVIKAMQGLSEQGMAKVSIQEGIINK